MRPNVFEYAGGAPAWRVLAAAHHARCLADPELNHPFDRDDLHPQHVERLAAYWAEVFGGPPTYSTHYSNHGQMLHLHAGNGVMSDLGRRFVECFALAADDAGLPADPLFRAVLHAYMEWAVAEVLSYPEREDVPYGAAMPRWSWDGLQTPAAAV
jgi:hemoglobin